MPSYRDIKPFVREACYQCTVQWDYIEHWLSGMQDRVADDGKAILRDGLVLCPDFQRGHVWTPVQQTAYVEYILRGGASGKDIYLNNPSWGKGYDKHTVVVDGLQRITAARAFVANKIKAFGYEHSEWKDRMPGHCRFEVHVHNLQTRAEVLEWYIGFNAGGTPHSTKEINRVKALLQAEKAQS